MKVFALALGFSILGFALGDETEDGGTEPTKHPFQQCLEAYNSCMPNADGWEMQKKCFFDFYECQNDYTRKCRKLYKAVACYEILGKDKCLEKLRKCYGSNSDGE